jgi:dihydrodipicolinate synthase/N-acetylneuraminate lyase
MTPLAHKRAEDMTRTTDWRGVFPSIPTPFTDEGGVDLVAQRNIVRFAVDHGADGLICFGLAGEVLQLAPDERERLAEVIVDEVAGAVPVLVGVGAESEHVSRRLARAMEATGVDGVVIPPPATTGFDPGTLHRYFARIAETVSLPVMIQDAPDLLGVEVGPELVKQTLASAENVQYIKLEVAGDGIARWVAEIDGAAAIFGGNGGMYILDCLRAGAVGVAPGLEVVDLLSAIHDAEVGGDTDAAELLFSRFLPLVVFEQQDIHHHNGCCKYILSRRGVDLPTQLCPPARQLKPEAIPVLERYIEALQLAPDQAGKATS